MDGCARMPPTLTASTRSIKPPAERSRQSTWTRRRSPGSHSARCRLGEPAAARLQGIVTARGVSLRATVYDKKFGAFDAATGGVAVRGTARLPRPRLPRALKRGGVVDTAAAAGSRRTLGTLMALRAPDRLATLVPRCTTMKIARVTPRRRPGRLASGPSTWTPTRRPATQTTGRHRHGRPAQTNWRFVEQALPVEFEPDEALKRARASLRPRRSPTWPVRRAAQGDSGIPSDPRRFPTPRSAPWRY